MLKIFDRNDVNDNNGIFSVNSNSMIMASRQTPTKYLPLNKSRSKDNLFKLMGFTKSASSNHEDPKSATLPSSNVQNTLDEMCTKPTGWKKVSKEEFMSSCDEQNGSPKNKIPLKFVKRSNSTKLVRSISFLKSSRHCNPKLSTSTHLSQTGTFYFHFFIPEKK